MTVIEAAQLLTSKAVEAGYETKTTPSPASDTIYLTISHPILRWSVRVRVSDHDLSGRERYPLEIRTIEPESAFDDVIARLTER